MFRPFCAVKLMALFLYRKKSAMREGSAIKIYVIPVFESTTSMARATTTKSKPVRSTSRSLTYLPCSRTCTTGCLSRS
jgi:hypothetical protein